jgi:hypothetical protein
LLYALQFICHGRYDGFKFNFVPLVDIWILLVFKFKLIMDTSKGYAYSKSRWSQFFSHSYESIDNSKIVLTCKGIEP